MPAIAPMGRSYNGPCRNDNVTLIRQRHCIGDLRDTDKPPRAP